MRKLGLSVAGIVMAGMAAFMAPAHANLVTNGGFETGDFSGWTQSGDTDFNGVQCSGPSSSVYAGRCAANIGSLDVSGIAQTINFGSAGLKWDLSFALKADDSDASTSFTAMFGGQTLLSLTDLSAGDYTVYRFSGVTTEDNMALAFNFVAGFTFLGLDDVSVTATAVPEPVTTGLMGAGLASLLFLRRRKTV